MRLALRDCRAADARRLCAVRTQSTHLSRSEAVRLDGIRCAHRRCYADLVPRARDIHLLWRSHLAPRVNWPCNFLVISWAVGSVLSRKWQIKVEPFVATRWEKIFAGLGHVLLLLITGQYHRAVFHQRGVAPVLYLVVFGSWMG